MEPHGCFIHACSSGIDWPYACWYARKISGAWSISFRREYCMALSDTGWKNRYINPPPWYYKRYNLSSIQPRSTNISLPSKSATSFSTRNLNKKSHFATHPQSNQDVSLLLQLLQRRVQRLLLQQLQRKFLCSLGSRDEALTDIFSSTKRQLYMVSTMTWFGTLLFCQVRVSAVFERKGRVEIDVSDSKE